MEDLTKTEGGTKGHGFTFFTFQPKGHLCA